ncbi:hypothetical protein CDAR_109961 [Caerostris darwini]|uniref:Uncharacterized protein n=1 Tax=Caerostris darwini TaxID=1538125 RepID=A0AAV4P3Z1_9ARAC|nr:hypothetical protein CDAR_109961 [Caerostris darwini]
MGVPLPNLRRQLRLSAGGQRVRGSQSRLNAAPQSPPINQLQSPCDREEILGKGSLWLMAIVVHWIMAAHLHSFLVDVSGYENGWWLLCQCYKIF